MNMDIIEFVRGVWSYWIKWSILIMKHRFSWESLPVEMHRSVLLFGSTGLRVSHFPLGLGSHLCNSYTAVRWWGKDLLVDVKRCSFFNATLHCFLNCKAAWMIWPKLVMASATAALSLWKAVTGHFNFCHFLGRWDDSGILQLVLLITF